MTSSQHVYESKRRAFLATTLSSLILCVLGPTALQAIGGAVHKTDAELTAALIGTWEVRPIENPLSFRKVFLTFNADGTSNAIAIRNDPSPHRAEIEGKWRVDHGYLIVEATKITPANRGIIFYGRDQIESIDNRIARLRDEKGNTSAMRMVSHLPTHLPPLLTPASVPELSAAEVKKIAVSTPQPDYPIDARLKRTGGGGVFKLVLTEKGKVASIQVLKSTGSKILDDAAEKALIQWRFKPGFVRAVNVPINFVPRRLH